MDPHSLKFVFAGWAGHNESLRSAIAPRTAEELAWRPAPDLPSVGEVVAHLAIGRPIWFARMDAPKSQEVLAKLAQLRSEQKEWIDPNLTVTASRLVEMIDETWAMIDATLSAWSIDDLAVSYAHDYLGTKYAVSRQWTVWRILSHDLHHGGQICEMLYQQGIEIEELGNQGGHLTEPPVWHD